MRGVSGPGKRRGPEGDLSQYQSEQDPDGKMHFQAAISMQRLAGLGVVSAVRHHRNLPFGHQGPWASRECCKSYGIEPGSSWSPGLIGWSPEKP